MELAPTTGREHNPLWNGNKMKLGIFGANVSNGCAMTMAEGRLETSWPNTKRARLRRYSQAAPDKVRCGYADRELLLLARRLRRRRYR